MKYFTCDVHPDANILIHDLLMSPTLYRITCNWTQGRPGYKDFHWCDKELGKVRFKQDGTYILEPTNAEH